MGRSERKKWMCLSRWAEQAELGREGGEIDPPKKGISVCWYTDASRTRTEKKNALFYWEQINKYHISLWRIAVAGGLFVHLFSRKEEENKRKGELPSSVMPQAVGLISERGAGYSITCNIAAKLNKTQRHTSSGSACPGPSRRTGSFNELCWLSPVIPWKWLIFSLADVSSRFFAAHETIRVSKLAVWAGNLFYT